MDNCSQSSDSPLFPASEALISALNAFSELHNPRVTPLQGGLIHQTFLVHTDDGEFILQRVNAIFEANVNHRIVAVTQHLRSCGLVAPRLLLSKSGQPWTESDGIWRVMTRIPGIVFQRVQDLSQARSAGAMVAQFHSALADFTWSFQTTRTHVHDTKAHLDRLRDALTKHTNHRAYPAIAKLAQEIFTEAEKLPLVENIPARLSHGDLKFNNIIFAGQEPPQSQQAICLIDLDTVGPMPLHYELGDAWRSWCNPCGEDSQTANFDLAIFSASLTGYMKCCTFALSKAELQALLHGVEWISLELTARFAADALNECYFGWDRQNYATASEHNLVRARGQWSLFQQTLQTREERRHLLGV